MAYPIGQCFDVRKLSQTVVQFSMHQRPGPGCSKLTTSLVNVSLNFQKLISQICQFFVEKNVRSFCCAKASLIFSTKNFSVLGDKAVKHLTS